MTPLVTIEIPASSEALVRRVLALQAEMNALALSAPDGTVLDVCEEIESAEKRGRRSASAGAVDSRKTAGGPVANTSRLSAS
jgi:hypothetical protein